MAPATLLTLLTITNPQDKPLIEILGEKILWGTNDIQFVDSELNKLIPDQNKCYSLSSLQTALIPAKSCSPEFKSFTKIPLPYNPQQLVDTIILVRN